MSDFQDEQGLGELPSDLGLQEKQAFILPSSPSSDIRSPQPQTGNLGMNVPNSGKGLVKFIFDSRPLFGEDLVFTGYCENTNYPNYSLGTFTYKVPDTKILIIRSIEYVTSVLAGGPNPPVGSPAPNLVNFNFFINNISYDNFVNIDSSGGIKRASPQFNTDCFIVVPPGSTILPFFNFDTSFYSSSASFRMRGNLLLSNGETAQLQASGA